MHNVWLCVVSILALVCTALVCAGALAVEPPADLYATTGDAQAELYWDPVPDATSYKLYRSEQSGSGYVEVGEATDLFLLDSGLANGTSYYYVVTALEGVDQSAYSAEVAVTPLKTLNVLTFTRMSDEFYYLNPWLIDSTYALNGADPEQEVLYVEGESAIGENCAAPRLTADGRYMIFIANGMIRRLDRSSHELVTLRAQNVYERGLAVSPTTGEVAYVYESGGRRDIHIMDLDGGNDRAVTDDTYNDRWPEFARDGSHLVFVTNRPGKDEIHRVNPDGTGLTCLTSNTRNERRLAYAPDGSLIAFHAYTSSTQGTEIYTVDSAGGSLTQQSAGTSQDEIAPAFSPHGEWLAWIWIEKVWNATHHVWEYRHHIRRKRLSDGALAFITKSSYHVHRKSLAWHGKTDGMPPKRVADLAASSPTAESIMLGWTAPGDDGRTGTAAAYDVRYSTSPIDETSWDTAWRVDQSLVPQPTGSTESLAVTGLEADATYYFALKATDEDGNSADVSNVATATTLASADSIAPDPPPTLTATATDYLRNVLTWDPSPSGDVAFYRVFADGAPIGETNKTTFTHQLNEVDAVQYAVRAYDENANESSASSLQFAISKDDTVPAAPMVLRAWNTETSVCLKWEPNTEPDITGYEIWRKPDGGSWGHLDDVAGQADYEDASGVPEQKYFYAVKALDAAGNVSELSAEAEGIPGWPDNERVLIVINSNSADSVEIGTYYKLMRNVPDENVVTISAGTGTFISRDRYLSTIRDPVRDHIAARGLEDKLLYVVTTRGIPLMANQDDYTIRSVDSLLADLYGTVDPGWGGNYGSDNPYYLEDGRFSSSYGTLLVARLSGPSAQLAKGLVDRALYAEHHLDATTGKAWIDLRARVPNLTSGYYYHAERFIETAGGRIAWEGVETIIDRNSAMFPNGTCDNTLFYYGWYSYHNFQPIFDGYLKVGSVAWHLDSASAYILTNPDDPNWTVQMLMRGATISAGAVREPYTFAMQAGGIFYDRFFRGYTAAEAWWASIANTHWRMVLVGDPLYSPFREPPIADTDAPTISSIAADPYVAHRVRITWETDEVAEHRVEYRPGYVFSTDYDGRYTRWASVPVDSLERNVTYPNRVLSRDPAGTDELAEHRVEYGPGYVFSTDYEGWYTRWASVVVDSLEHNVTYSYRVLSRDPAGNERVQEAGTFEIPDDDSDGLPNAVETGTGVYVSEEDTGTYPDDDDSDDDGLIDGEEVYTHGTDPTDPDSDDDQLLDGVETNTGLYVSEDDTGTDPLDPDTDDDGLTDGDEVLVYRTNPNTPDDITDLYWDQATTSVVMTFASADGVEYVLERAEADAYADDLTWDSLPGDVLVGTAGQDSFTDDLSTNPLTHDFRFYRVKRSDGSNTSWQTASVFDLDLEITWTMQDFFISTPLVPDADHASVQDVFSTQINRFSPVVMRLVHETGLIERMLYDQGTQSWSLLWGSTFEIEPCVGYYLVCGGGVKETLPLRLTGYVPGAAQSVFVGKADWTVSDHWVAYSMPRPTTLVDLGLLEAVSNWNDYNVVRLRPLGSAVWTTYQYDAEGEYWFDVLNPGVAVNPPIGCGEALVFIRQGVTNEDDYLDMPTWYAHPPNEW